MDYDLINFDPVRNSGRGFSGWFHPSKRRVVFVPRMMHFQSVKNDGDFFDAQDTDLGPTYGIARGRINDCTPEEIYALMFAEGWARFHTEHDAHGTMVAEARDARTLQAMQRFAKFAGHSSAHVKLRLKTTYGEAGQELDAEFRP